MARFGKIELEDVYVARLSNGALVERLVDRGMSRLTATRVVAIERGTAEPGRARPHMQSRS